MKNKYIDYSYWELSIIVPNRLIFRASHFETIALFHGVSLSFSFFTKTFQRTHINSGRMVLSAALCVGGIPIGIKHSNPSGINSAGITILYTNLNSIDAESRWTHHNTTLRIFIIQYIFVYRFNACWNYLSVPFGVTVIGLNTWMYFTCLVYNSNIKRNLCVASHMYLHFESFYHKAHIHFL